MGQKKNFKYYLLIFGIGALAIIIFTVITWISTKTLDVTMLWSALLLPLLFTSFLFVFDKIFDRIFPKKRKIQESKEDFKGFVNFANKILDENGDFIIQDYRLLQDSKRFQKTLNQLYSIKNNGESEDLTIDYLSKKFKTGTTEYKAIMIIINELKKLD